MIDLHPIDMLCHHVYIHHLQHTTNDRHRKILNLSDTIFNVTGLRFYVHLCQQYFFSGEAGKPGFVGGRVGFPGTYHKYITVQNSIQV